MPAGRAGTVARVKHLPKGRDAEQPTTADNDAAALESLMQHVTGVFPVLAAAVYEQQRLQSVIEPNRVLTDRDLQALQQATTVELLGRLFALLAQGRKLSPTDCRLPLLTASAHEGLTVPTLTELTADWGRLPVRCLGDVYETLAAHRLVADDAAADDALHHSANVQFPLAPRRSVAVSLRETKAAQSSDVPSSQVPLSCRGATGLQVAATPRWGHSRQAFRLQPDKAGRRVRGMYYTPDAVVFTIVEKTIRPVLDARIERRPATLAEQSCIRVLDPAMGCGHFLVAAAELVARQLHKHLPAGIEFDSLRRRVIEHCMFGVDLDPLAVELTIASLWLHAGGGLDVAALRSHLTCGDSLLDACSGTFDAIVGNPPYGAMLDAATVVQFKRLLPQMKHNADTAVGFIERSSMLLADGGRCGLIVPKPLTYSFAWRRMRQFLHGRVIHLVDMSRVWSEVRLEQVILIFGRSASPAACTYDWSSSGKAPKTMTLPKGIPERFDVWPCSLSRVDARRLALLRLSDVTLGELCKTFRGLPAQRRLMPQGAVAVIGGRELERWRVRGVRGYLADDESANRLDFRRDKLLFQNIVAHIVRPQPHIRLIGAYDASGMVTLDTVNNVVPRHERLDLHGVLALLHSELINWFVYNVVYNRAIRTMHFDQYFLDKIPLPHGFEALLTQLAPLARQAADPAESVAALEAINAIVDAAYVSS